MSEKSNLANLNKEQYEAVTAPMGPVLVVAGAGTGKTSVLTKRISYLIQDLHLDPDRILAITFTNKAATEMNERVKKIINANLDWIGTFHSICIRILRRDIHLLNRNPNFKIIDEEETIVLLREIYEKNHFETKNLSYRNAVHLIDKIKCQHLTEADFNDTFKIFFYGLKSKKDAQIFWKIYLDFIERCETLNLVDFNDILNLTLKLLEKHEQAQEYWSNRFDYVLVDEFQDTNEIQYNLVKILSQKKNNLFVVGDPDQTIYTWRGAKQSIINNFDKQHPGTKIIILKQNYRSSQSILNAANQLIAKNTKRIHKDLVAANSENVGIKPLYYEAASVEGEANWVAEQISNLKCKGVDNKDIAILYRSNHLSRPIEQALVQYGFRYTIFGGFKFYQRSEIKDMLAYLSAICNHDEISLRRIINTPSRRISDVAVQAILNYSHENNCSFWEACQRYEQNPYLSSTQKKAVANFLEIMDRLEEFKNNRLDKIVVEIMKEVRYQEYLEHVDKQTAKNKLDYIEELLNAMSSYMERNPNWTLAKYLQDITLFISSDDKNNKKDTISLMTVHTSKGLEFPYVFLIGFNNGIFPSDKDDSIDSMEEERRIAYVALTRAQKQLAISSNTSYSCRLQTTNSPSEFLKDIGIKNLDVIKKTFKTISNADLEFFDSQKNPNLIPYEKPDLNDIKNDYKIGDQIIHTIFGLGVVIGIDVENIIVRFGSNFGTKRIVFNHKSVKRLLS